MPSLSMGVPNGRLRRSWQRWAGFSVRPGLVYGGRERGLYGKLCFAIRKLPILPRFVRPRPVTQPIHVDDLAEGLLRVALGMGRPGTVLQLAQTTTLPFDKFLQEIARGRLGLRRQFLPLPLGPMLPALALAQRLLRRDFGVGQLFALAQTRAMETSADLATLNLSLRTFDISLRPGLLRRKQSGAGSRRLGLQEGQHLLTYLLGATPKASLIARYARSLEARTEMALLSCPENTLRSSLALAILDRPNAVDLWDLALQQRLKLALRIAEASPGSFDRFIGNGPHHRQRLKATVAVCFVLLKEMAVRIARLAGTGSARCYLQSIALRR